jgi:hypothetical protein
MSDNGSGVYLVNSTGQPVVSDTPITAAVFNAYTADVATALSNRICKDGQTTVGANIPMATYKFTGLGNGSARTDSANLANVQDGTGVYVGTVAGTATAITLTPSPAITAYVAGQKFSFSVAATNTGATTVAISGLAAKNIVNGTLACVGGELRLNDLVTIQYDGTQFELLNYRKGLDGWTPSITCTTPGDLSVAYTGQTGYVEISGNKITAWFNIVTSSFTHTTASGNLIISGLPFRASTLMSPFIGGAVLFSGMTKANYTQVVSGVTGAASTILLYASGSAQAVAVVAITDFPTGGSVQIKGCVTYTHDGG